MSNSTDTIQNIIPQTKKSPMAFMNSGSPVATVIISLYGALGVWIVTVNTVTLVVFARCRQLQSKRNVLVISLAAVDLFTGTTPFLPKLITGLVAGVDSFTACAISSSIQLIPPWTSLLHIIGIAVERYIAINRPLTYHATVTSPRLLACIGVSLSVSCLVAIIPLAWPRDQFSAICLSILWYPRLYSVFFLVIPIAALLAAMVVLYTHILLIARRQERAICLEASRIGQTGGSQSPDRRRHESRATYTFVLICGVALACYIPFWIAIVLVLAAPWSDVAAYGYYVASLGLYANSGMNFVIYVVHNSLFKSQIKLLCRRKNRIATIDGLGSVSESTSTTR